MAKKPKQTTKTCSDCIHENACRIWTDGRFISDASASVCPNHETVKESAAYLCGVLDERNRKKTNADKIRKMTDDELSMFLNKIVVNHHIKNADNCNHCPLKDAAPCDTAGIIDWLKQPRRRMIMGLAIAFNPCTICDKKEMCSMCELDMRRKGNVETVQEWLSVKDRLPEKDQIVLCYKAGRGVRIGKHLVATFADGVSAFKDCLLDYAFGATHWMPLPEPPKGE